MHFSISELVVILLVALLVIKPAHLPGAAKTLARGIRWFKSTSDKVKQEITDTLNSDKHS